MYTDKQQTVTAQAVTINQPTAYTPTAPYAALQDNNPSYVVQSWNPYSPTVIYKTEPAKCKNCGWCCCVICCIILVVTLLCVFLIPKPPRVEYENGVVLITTTEYWINETYKVSNPNYYSIQFDHVNLTVEYSGEAIGWGTMVPGELTVPKRDTEEMVISYDLFTSASAAQKGDVYTDCLTTGYASYTIRGTMNARFWLATYNDIDLGPWETELYCEL